MKSKQVVAIVPSLLVWARKSIGLSVSDVANQLGRTITEIESWESGASAPSYPQLEKLAYQIYKRPLAIFFLPSPPEEITPSKEFRTLPDSEFQKFSSDTYIQFRRAHAFQVGIRELFNENSPSKNCIWKEIKLSLDKSIITQSNQIRTYLGININEQSEWKNDDFALKKWRTVIENAGVFVFKSSFKQKNISGFCLMDLEFPLIYLNNSNTKTRQIFSLFHEIGHILLSLNGINVEDPLYFEHLPKKEKNVEKFCNAIAAEILIPTHDFHEQIKLFPKNVSNASESDFSNLANRYSVSREAILRRFLEIGLVSQDFYLKKAKQWAAQKKSASGGDWYASQNVYLSERYAKEVVSRHYRDQINLETAADLLGIKPKNFEGLEQKILQGVSL